MCVWSQNSVEFCTDVPPQGATLERTVARIKHATSAQMLVASWLIPARTAVEPSWTMFQPSYMAAASILKR